MPRHASSSRTLSLVALASLLLGAPCGSPVPAPVAGRPDHVRHALWSLREVVVNLAGGSVSFAWDDLVLDTRVMPLALGVSVDSVGGTRFSWEPGFDGSTFVDRTGAHYDLTGLAPGDRVPGSSWTYVDAATLETRGGLVHAFDSAGRLEAIHWRNAPYPRLEFVAATVAGAPRTVEIVQREAANDSKSFATIEYDAGGRVVALEDRAGRRAEYAWSSAGRLLAARDGLDVALGLPGRRIDWNAGLPIRIRSSEDEEVALAFRGSRVIGIQEEGVPAWSFAYQAQAGAPFRTTVTDPHGQTRHLDWDTRRRVQRVESPVGGITTLAWDGLRVAERIEPSGEITLWVWEDDELRYHVEPSGNWTHYLWADGALNRLAPGSSALLSATDVLGPVETRSYDPSGRLASWSNGEGETWTFVWGALGQLKESHPPSGITRRFSDYGAHGHPRRVESGAGVFDLVYDAVGNRLRGPGPSTPGAGPGGVIAREFDADRNVTGVVLADQDYVASRVEKTLHVTYRSDGQLLRIARPYGGDTEWSYDPRGRASTSRERVDGVWRTTVLERDAFGRVTAVERPNGMRTETRWDEAGRRAAVSHLRDGVHESTVDFSYLNGRLSSQIDTTREGPKITSWDDAGRLEQIVFPGGESLVFGYDLRSRVVSEHYRLAGGASLASAAFEYDLANRETRAELDGVLLRSRTFTEARVASETFGSGATRSYLYGGEDGLVEQAELRDADGVRLERTTWLREVAGLPPGFHEYQRSVSSGPLSFTFHEHVWLGPVGSSGAEASARVAAFASSSSGSGVSTFRWDELSNLLAIQGGSGLPERSFDYNDERNRLLRVRGGAGGVLHDYVYDEAGFATFRDGRGLDWDGGGRLRSIGAETELEWDTLGALVSWTRAGVRETFLFGGRIRADATGSARVLELGAVAVDLQSGARRYRHLDARGNVLLVSDELGELVAHARHAPHGVDRLEGLPDPDAGFALGAELDDGLLLLGVRPYDPEARRFLSPDPVFAWLNAYAYTLGDPLRHWDPDGRRAQGARAIAAGVAIGGMAGAALLSGTLLAPATAGAMATFWAASAIGVVLDPVEIAASALSLVGGGTAAVPGLAPFVASFGGGFLGGQALGRELDLRYDGVPKAFDGPPYTLPSPPSPQPPQFKRVDIRIAPPDATPPGCSPTQLAAAPILPTRVVLLLVGLQVALGLTMARARRRGPR